MIERYECPEISQIWSEQNKFETFLKVELALLRALEGVKIPPGTADIVKGKAKVNPERIKEIEKVSKHDVIAFCSSITEQLPNDVSKFFHFGCTSSDIIDTATTLQIRDSLDLILAQHKNVLKALEKKSRETKDILCMGRSHGMNAEPMSFGQKFLTSYAEFFRRYQDLKRFRDEELTGQMSGSVGNYTLLDLETESRAMRELGLKAEPVSTQVIPRDRIAKLLSVTALIASAIERLAVEIRHLHHSDVGEVFEGFAKGQKGSSIMPHKKNPISAENLSGLARVMRSHLGPALENIPLWHERDISHSSAERMILPDNLGLLFYSLRRLASTIDNLVVNRERIQSKAVASFQHLSSLVLHRILEQTDISREDAYALTQQAAFQAKDANEFIQILKKDKRAAKVELPDIASMGDEAMRKLYMAQTEQVFERVFAQYPCPQ